MSCYISEVAVGYFTRLHDQLALLSDHMDFCIGKQFSLHKYMKQESQI